MHKITTNGGYTMKVTVYKRRIRKKGNQVHRIAVSKAPCPRCGGAGTFNDGSVCYYCNGKGTV